MNNNKFKNIAFFPSGGWNCKEYVQEAFETNRIAPLRSNVDRFVNDFEKYLGDLSCCIYHLDNLI